MKTKILLAVLASVFFMAACEKEYLTDENDPTPIQKSAVMGEGTIVSNIVHFSSLEGNILDDPADRKVNVYLPKSYFTCPEKHFPVIYFLHGTPSWSDMLLDPLPFEYFFQAAGLQAPVDFPEEGFLAWLNNLIDNEGMKEVIIVMPDAKAKYGPSMYVNSSTQGNYEDYIVDELVSYIDQNYRTIAHFNWRSISGHCAGAYGALNAAMKHPKVFRYVGALSPPHFPAPLLQYLTGFIALEDQMWGVDGPLPYDPQAPFKFANNGAYNLSQAWLPNPENPPYYCDLPLDYVDGNWLPNTENLAKWDSQSLMVLAEQYRTELKQLKTVYFDCGTNDDLGMYQSNVMFHKQLEAMHIKHQFETYSNPGTHISNLYERLGMVWTMLSNDFPEYED
ncbi:alpha/beta hydrolase [Maribellus sediminis]|uniref:alpha/beta hydrolase n=1 Tax=Maribellus sediminis TaxID=2696285 RepID=UPI00142FAA69|nr:alpha/beta hydrolase-fold protein [Maribellus sediminis]